MHQVLNKPDFSIHGLVDAKKYRINEYTPKGRGGIYVRLYLSGKNATFWTPGKNHLYFGHTIEFCSRYTSHQTKSTAKHSLLKETAERMIMFPVAIFEHENKTVYLLIEQIFVCLLQTWRRDVFAIRPGGSGAKLLAERPTAAAAVDAAHYYKMAIDLVAAKTGWPGGVLRESFQVPFGVNFSSPLQEIVFTERPLLLRKDTWIMNKQTGEPYQIAEFRRAKSKLASWRERKSATGKSTNFGTHVFSGASLKDGGSFSFEMFCTETPNGINGPLPGSRFYVTIDVRLDWKPHSKSWACLPEIGPYEDWDRANSWAIRANWEHPPASGQWRHRWIQYFTPSVLIATNVPGGFNAYAQGIRMIHWLFGETPTHKHSWIPDAYGAAFVKQMKWDFLTMTIDFATPVRLPPPISAARRSAASIKAQMKQPQYLLEGVDGPFQEKVGHRGIVCDTCRLMAFDNTPCIQVADRRVCKNCLEIYGRPCCSWTPTLRNRSTQEDKMSPDQIVQRNTIRSALICRPAAPRDSTPISTRIRFIADRPAQDSLMADEDEVPRFEIPDSEDDESDLD
ncbi:hypothetical protein BU24DRAFT_467528 [Aaosphaeria arxii CBS 175.79]|uniref:GIY-YIG domain-containing protein n=1 Tax=Aaosphaeria arxii CBS 175.79 TaxID=1450172 RepID=A0A6A5XAV3_9PLEO|nr:uncharacterized protein BU24DRAFT_467528 [Aaosphaeria arxii CBS 175.79]KAF2010040.1 hypothetical protein BU24DRAFT_467528 [Aaosphaeria arxii CBS 175.79]